MSAETVIDEIIQSARSIAEDTSDEAKSLAQQAQLAATVVTDLGQPPSIQKPAPALPPVPPTADTVLEFKSSFDELFNKLGPVFDSRLSALIARFFPRVEQCLANTADDWLCNTILNGGTGIPVAVENQIWERSRAREALDAMRQQDEVTELFASRGYTLPPGALLNSIARIQDGLSQKVSTHSRDVAIKQVEIEIENIRFAVAESTKLRLGAVGATIDYLRAWLGTVTASVDYGTAVSSARLKLFDSSSAYYKALIDAEALILDWGKSNSLAFLKQQENFVGLVKSNTDARVHAAVSSAASIASIASAAMAAQNSLASISHNTVEEG